MNQAPFQWVKDNVVNYRCCCLGYALELGLTRAQEKGTAKLSLVRESLLDIPEGDDEAELAQIEAFGIVYSGKYQFCYIPFLYHLTLLSSCI